MPDKSRLDLKFYKDHSILIEQLEDDIAIRSQKCILGVTEVGSVCKHCQAIDNYVSNKPSELSVEVETTLDNEKMDEEPMESESLEVSGMDTAEEGNEYKNERSVDPSNALNETKTNIEMHIIKAFSNNFRLNIVKNNHFNRY